MKKVYLATMLSLAMTTAHAQEPNIPMFAGQQQIDVKFNDYKAAPQGFDKEREGVAKGTVKLIEYQSASVGTVPYARPMSICPPSTTQRRSIACSISFMASEATKTSGTKTVVSPISSWTTSMPRAR